ncbi:MAG: TetR/AcrR family transcriptional regulator [Solirubrobacteraceae bacterium]|nr:TetR/AcrR family transcriptional regulator [Solirubrobacteraceae bacterium]
MPGIAPPDPDHTSSSDRASVPADRGEALPLSRERVIAAAVALAERSGLDALSMRRLADELGVSTMAAYRHVPAKQTLVDDVVERALSWIPAAELLARDDEDWAERLEELVVESHRTVTRFPGLLAHMRAGALGRPGVLNWVGAISQLVERSGASEERRAGAVTAIVWCLNGASRLEEDRDPMLVALDDVAGGDEPTLVDAAEWRDKAGARSAEDMLRVTLRTIVAGLRPATP